jgi:hypothetical protein
VSKALGASIEVKNAPVPRGQTCLVGTWRDDGGHTSVYWHGHPVEMYGGGGAIDHISSSSQDSGVFSASMPEYGTYRGHTLKEVLRGVNNATLRVADSHTLLMIEQGWSPESTNTFTYEGRRYLGYFSQSGTYTYSFQCTAHKLVVRQQNYYDTETRVSLNP